MSELILRNRQRLRPLPLPRLRAWVEALLADVFGASEYELGLHFVGPVEMARINRQFLQHEGSTDVITFDHRESAGEALHGEIFICVADAVGQARRFGTRWPEEVARYVIHGLLHLHGHDDRSPGPRRRMKRVENRLVREVGHRFPLSRPRRKPRVKS
jgi:probable rRNA maturation factor